MTDGGGAEPSTTLRSEHVESTRRAVLAAARSAFGRKGYAQTSVDEIAAVARVIKGAVYHHFAGKKALFRVVRLQFRSSIARRRSLSTVTATRLDDQREESFFGPLRRDRRVVDDFIAAFAGCARNSSWTPPRRSRGSTGRSC